MAGKDSLFGGASGGWGDSAPLFDERRQKLIDAFTRVAAEKGYERVSEADVAAAAGLPDTTYYEYFDDIRQCLVAAYDSFFYRLELQAQIACAGAESWPAAVKAAVAAALEFLRETASRSRLFLVEAIAGGMPLYERKLALTSRFAEMLEEGRDGNAVVRALPRSTEWILVGGALDRISEYLLAEEPGALVNLEPELVELVLTPFVGAAEARRVALA